MTSPRERVHVVECPDHGSGLEGRNELVKLNQTVDAVEMNDVGIEDCFHEICRHIISEKANGSVEVRPLDDVLVCCCRECVEGCGEGVSPQ